MARATALREAIKAEREHARGEGGLAARVEVLERELGTLRRSVHDLRDRLSGLKAAEDLARLRGKRPGG